MNRYDLKKQEWRTLQEKLVDGEGERNAYWQLAVTREGAIHLSWVWRETGDVATNHDLCYAKSTDGGRTWLRSSGEIYRLPITMESAEQAWRIPEGSELINQTSMDTDNMERSWMTSLPRQYQFWNGSPVKVLLVTECPRALTRSAHKLASTPMPIKGLDSCCVLAYAIEGLPGFSE